MIRELEDKDIIQILDLYNYYIENTTYTLEIKKVDYSVFYERVKKIHSKFPFIVEDIDGKIIGYAYIDTFHPRAAYRMSVDLSIYVDKDYLSQGYGKILLDEICFLAKANNYFNIVSLVTDENERSISFHIKNGFEPSGYLPHIAYKFDRWVGLRYFVKRLNNSEKYE